MCGIAGIVGEGWQQHFGKHVANKMIAQLSHRGPDQYGLYIHTHATLAHVRLSIIDLTTGAQPIHNEDKTLWITFNGEIFNYKHWRDYLITKGHRFTTTSDTEVIIHLFEEFGEACVEKLNGQFAFAIWNEKIRSLFLARDRVGIRPLHYIHRNGFVLFASEAKALFAVPGIDARIDDRALMQTFTFWTTLPGYTIFQDVAELPPGHTLTCNHQGVRIRRYWQWPLRAKEDKSTASCERLAQQAGELLHDAIHIRLQADVPVGAYLSGGLDSSGIVSIISSRFKNNLSTFGISFSDKRFDESSFQQSMVSRLGTAHTGITVSDEEIGRYFKQVIFHCERPLLRTSPVPLYLLSRAVNRTGLKVVLTGEGADEVFGGYNIFREALVRRFWARHPESSAPGLLAEKLYPYLLSSPVGRLSLITFLRQAGDQSNEPFYSHALRWRNTARLKALFAPELRERLHGYDCIDELRETLPTHFHKVDLLDRAQYLEATIFLSSYLLCSQGDRMAMAHSLEIRLPFLDHRIIEYMAAVPNCWKILGLQEKYLLRKILKPYLPAEIADRPKNPYRAPIHKAIVSPGASQVEAQDAMARYFDPKRLHPVFHRGINGKDNETDGMAMAGMLSTAYLHETFILHWTPASPFEHAPSVMIDRTDRG